MRLSQYYALIKKNINLHTPYLFREPLLLHVDITNRCNLKCKHCDVWRFKEKKDISFKVFSKLIDETYALGIRFIAISGGEPLMHTDFLKFITYPKKKGIYVNLSTNGILLNESNINYFKKIKLDSLIVSIESIGKNYDKLRGSKNNYPKLLKNLRELMRNNLDLHIGICITDKNFMDLPHILDVLNKEGIYKIYFYPFYYSPRNVIENHMLYQKMNKFGKLFTDEEISSYNKVVKSTIKNNRLDVISKLILKKSIGYFDGKEISLKELPCYAPLFSAVIGFDGEVSPCWYSTKSLGNIHTDSFKNIWYSEGYMKIRNDIRNRKCHLTTKNCLNTHRITSARLDLFFMIRMHLLNMFTKYQ